jgi:hypothetical protein
MRSLPFRSLALSVLLGPWSAPFGCVPVQNMEGAEEDGALDGGDDQDPQGDGDGPNAEPGTCNAWKISLCDAVTRCSFDTQEECETDVGYVMCKADAPVGRCARELEDADCDELPKDCDARDIADRSLPQKVCQDLQEASCEWSLTCGYELSLEACLANQASVQPCSDFTAVLPGYEDCLEAVRFQPCNGTLPASCQGLLRR